MSERPEDHPVFRMTLPEVLALVADLEEKYRTWTLPHVAPTGTAPVPPVTLADLATIRASLQRSVAHLDRLLVDWDREQR